MLEVNRASHEWWRSLSINEMKKLSKKYYPQHIWTFISDTPSLVRTIHEQTIDMTIDIP